MIEFKLNSQKNLAGFKTEVLAKSFEDCMALIFPPISGLINILSSTHKIPFYIKRIVIKSPQGILKSWFLTGFKPASWKGNIKFSKLNRFRNHVLSIKKEIITSYYHPAINLANQLKLYELFNRTLKIGQKNKIFEVTSFLEPISLKIIDKKNKILGSKTYGEAFNFIQTNFRDKISHGIMKYGEDFANMDNLKLFFEAIPLLSETEQIQEDVFIALMSLPDNFDITSFKDR